ncbi:hypothetical protein [Streptomyces cupreus]|uniref:Uncharacterized protein n=1 Tax=Streptomyces cupreus TaxID=2759956 RepID=A0A7X1J4V4_9ACTN|nr:hypothetical protein [Streptomyces cupreus]MBC2903620.1 hypothetical protein [Streptomyces cupreus]
MTRMITPLRAEVRLAAQPAAVLTVLIAGAAAVRAVFWYLDAATRGMAEADQGLAALATPAGAVQAAAWHHASLLGLVLAALLGGVVLAEGLESGTWPLVRLYQARVWLLMVRKLVVVLFLGVLSMAVTAAVLWTAIRICQVVEPPGGPRHLSAPSDPAPPDVHLPGWGDASAACAKALLVLSFFATLTLCAAAAARAVIPAAVLGAGPLAATLPLVTTGWRTWTPHYWIAAWMELPDSTQWNAYWWSSTPGAPDTDTALAVLCTSSGALLVVTLLLLRAERSLSARI